VTSRSLSELYWRSANGRADRVLVLVFIGMAALGGAMFGLARASTTTHIVHMMDKVVEYIRLPPAVAPAQTNASRDTTANLLAQHRCLAEAIYYEARGEGAAGEKAVAEVVLNRLHSGAYGHSICQVVYEGAPRLGCQFSFACDGSRYKSRSPADWRSAERLAARILTGEEMLTNATGEAINYHAVQVSPVWSKRLIPTAQIGNHMFYRPRGGPAMERIALRSTLD